MQMPANRKAILAINKSGKIGDTSIARSSGNKILEDTVLRTLKPF
jgi:outer membrane biosynthesis protein TonB